MIFRIVLLGLTFSILSTANANALTKVQIFHVEALSSKDTDYSTRFKNDYEKTIKTTEALSKRELEKCGYELSSKTIFYDSSDPLQAKEGAEVAQNGGAWLIVGPARSNHYLLAAKGAPITPSVSPLASSEKVFVLGGQHKSLSPSNSQMAKAAAEEAMERIKGNGRSKTYSVIVSGECLSCKDFSQQFDEFAKAIGLQKLSEYKVIGKTPELDSIRTSVEKQKPAFILLPNYSKLTAHVLSKLGDVSSRPFFVGGDGWGDSNFGFVQNSIGIDKAIGFTVRGYPPTANGIDQFHFGRITKRQNSKNGDIYLPSSSSALAQLRIIEATMRVLCKYRPKSRGEFKKYFIGKGARFFDSPWGVSVYDLSKGSLKYGSSRKL